MEGSTQMPPNSATSSYAKIASTPVKRPEKGVVASRRSPIMGPHTDTSLVEGAPSSQPDSKSEINAPEHLDDAPQRGPSSGDSETGPSNSYAQVVPPNETPQQTTYYGAYNNSQVTPESPSPNSSNARTAYAGGSFFPQSAPAFQVSPFTNDGNHPYPGSSVPQPPTSPTQSMGGIPPASPLFPRMTGPVPAYLNTPRGGEAGLNPGMSPVTSAYASSGMYIPGTYPVPRPSSSSGAPNSGNPNTGNGNEEYVSWNDSRNTPYSLPPGGMPFVPGMPPRPDRSSSFDDSGLPHSSSDGSQNAYGAGPGAGPQAWGYGPPPPDPYGNNSNLSQGRPTGPYPGQHGGQYRLPSQYGGPYGGHYGFPATSPGPPIQMTSSNKGPDGANLFIFHIPNHFTNMDMYHLFSPYGNLLSVRIMVEKDSGRSRGFGFVSYDNPDAAALAIKGLNGYAIGNKRLKVQHKQIRPAEQQHNQEMNHGGHQGHGGHHYHHGGGRGRGGRGSYMGRGGGGNMPPMPSPGWYHPRGSTNTNDMNNPGISQPPAPGDEAQHVVVVLGDNPSNSTNVKTAESAGTSSAVIGQDDKNTTADPLSSMDPLRQTLPDIGGMSTTPASSDN